MRNYQNCKIYKIINDNVPGKVYYGHTTTTLTNRLCQHNKWYNTCTSRELTKEPGAKIILVEAYPCESIEYAKARERYYIENNECVNKVIPGRTKKEYYKENKHLIKIYYEKNKNLVKIKGKEYRENPEIKERQKEQRKKYRQENKEVLAEKNKIYRKQNKEKLTEYRKEYHKKYYENNKEKLAEKINCICGSIYRKDAISSHLKTKKHQDFINNNN